MSVSVGVTVSVTVSMSAPQCEQKTLENVQPYLMFHETPYSGGTLPIAPLP